MDLLSRRDFFTLVAAAGLSVTRREVSGAVPAPRKATGAQSGVTPDQALGELLAGNKRFASGTTSTPRRQPKHFRLLAGTQHPHSIIVACADSRVAPEILFDTGLGDIFVVRVAGNVVESAGVVVTGSIESAVAELNVPMIMVLGHSNCGAVKAALNQINAKEQLPGAIDGLVKLIKPAVLKSKGLAGDPLDNAIRANVSAGVERLKGLDPILAPRVREAKLKVVGGIYDLATGTVTTI
jgi:carbonic anhydrase